MYIRLFGRIYNLIHRRIRFSIGDIVLYTSAKQINILRNQSNLRAKALKRELSHIISIYCDPALRHVVKPRKQ